MRLTKVFTTVEAGEKLGVSRYTMRRLAENNDIDADYVAGKWLITKDGMKEAAAILKKRAKK